MIEEEHGEKKEKAAKILHSLSLPTVESHEEGKAMKNLRLHRPCKAQNRSHKKGTTGLRERKKDRKNCRSLKDGKRIQEGT